MLYLLNFDEVENSVFRGFFFVLDKGLFLKKTKAKIHNNVTL